MEIYNLIEWHRVNGAYVRSSYQNKQDAQHELDAIARRIPTYKEQKPGDNYINCYIPGEYLEIGIAPMGDIAGIARHHSYHIQKTTLW